MDEKKSIDTASVLTTQTEEVELLDPETHNIKSISFAKKFAKKEKTPKDSIDKTEHKNIGVENQLEESDKVLNELSDITSDLITNVRVANDKREILRRNYEAIKREELLQDLQKESIEADAKLKILTAKWIELDSLKEPMGLYEELEMQKERIDELMKQKDDIIKECQDEIKRADEKYYEDLEKQGESIIGFVERIDSQIEEIKCAYNNHIEILQQTIEEDRKTLACAATEKWEDWYESRLESEKNKMVKDSETSDFYSSELERISLEHDELTRATRIRLEKDAEALQLELQNVKNNVLLNSEKLNYNYQVLQKRDEENIIIKTQQKRRLSKLNDTIATLRKKIRETRSNSEAEIKKLTTEVIQLHNNILDLEAKADNFANMNEKKYQLVWEINFKEANTTLGKILDVDRILHEQQLGLEWCRPDVPRVRIKDLPSYKKASKSLNSKFTIGGDKNGTKDRRSDDEKLADGKILRQILRKISERVGFLVEEKLMEILKPYSEQQKALVKIDNIFTALGISKIDEVTSLIDYFLPYAWCPNCSDGLQEDILNKVREIEFDQFKIIDELTEQASSADGSARDTISTKSDEIKFDDGASGISDDSVQCIIPKSTTETKRCANHYLVIEPSLVVTALREFTKDNFSGITPITTNKSSPEITGITYKQKDTISRVMSKPDVEKFWSQFRNVFPEQKLKIWRSLEHGLNHYLKVLKDREFLDTEVEYLRKQNLELKHLLQGYLLQDDCTC